MTDTPRDLTTEEFQDQDLDRGAISRVDANVGVTDRPQDLTTEELENQDLDELPDREAMSLVDANVAVPVNAAVGANVLSDHASANPTATQNDPIHQDNIG